MDLLGLLNPTAGQAAGNQAITAQQQQQQQDLANILKKEGQNAGNKQFTSPWQVAGQWAQALAGRMKQGQVNQGSSVLNTILQPGAPDTAAAPVQGAVPQAVPGGGGQPAIPGQSPAAPAPPDPSTLPWSGNSSDAGTAMPDMSDSEFT